MQYNPDNVTVPQLILDNCKRDPRGLYVPFVVLEQDGKYHFKINDSEKLAKCVVMSLCSICGTKLSKEDRWLVGGIASALDPNGVYIDLPIHKECGHYALKVCPYMAIRNYNGKIDMVKLQKQFAGKATLENPTVDQDRLPFFVFIRPKKLWVEIDRRGMVVRKEPELEEVEFWDEGEQITDLDEILKRIANTKWQKYGRDVQRLPQFHGGLKAV